MSGTQKEFKGCQMDTKGYRGKATKLGNIALQKLRCMLFSIVHDGVFVAPLSVPQDVWKSLECMGMTVYLVFPHLASLLLLLIT